MRMKRPFTPPSRDLLSFCREMSLSEIRITQSVFLDPQFEVVLGFYFQCDAASYYCPFHGSLSPIH